MLFAGIGAVVEKEPSFWTYRLRDDLVAGLEHDVHGLADERLVGDALELHAVAARDHVGEHQAALGALQRGRLAVTESSRTTASPITA
jgi:hypothetical protein